jgi:hypothetical protein
MSNYSYLEAISIGFPTVQCHCIGDGADYNSLVWDAGDPIPDQTTLDQWILSNPISNNTIVTKYEFRSLFTILERVSIDNVQFNPSISDYHKSILVTIAKDMENAEYIDLTEINTQQGVFLIEQLGLIASGRTSQILANHRIV